MTLTPEQRCAMNAICGYDLPTDKREGWRPRADVEGIVGSEIVADLIRDDLAVEWVHPDGPQLTLTVWGVDRLGVELVERNEVTTYPCLDEKGKPIRKWKSEVTTYAYIGKNGKVCHPRRDEVETYETLIEIDSFAPVRLDERGQPADPPPIRLPARRFEYGMPFPDRVVDPSPGPAELVEAADEPPPIRTSDTGEAIETVMGIKVKRRKKAG